MYSGLYTSLVCISERHIAYVFLFEKGIWACRLQYNPLKSCMVLKVPKGRRIANFIPWYRGIIWNSRFTIPHMAICKYITWPRTTDYMMRRIYTNNWKYAACDEEKKYNLMIWDQTDVSFVSSLLLFDAWSSASYMWSFHLWNLHEAMHEGHNDLDQTTTVATYSSTECSPCLRSLSLSSVSTINVTFPPWTTASTKFSIPQPQLEIVLTVTAMFGDKEFNIHAILLLSAG